MCSDKKYNEGDSRLTQHAPTEAFESSRDTPKEIRRQAVVIIHGIGEQRPMATLRHFVDGVLADYEGKPRFWSKPDRITDTLELRRLVASKAAVRISTDFYEYYWAHQMTGTSWRHVIAWFQVLLLRKPKSVPFRLRTLWGLSWLLLLSGLWAIWRFDLTNPAALASFGAVAALLFVILRLVGGSFGLHFVGDAARYLSATPDNIAARHAIRSGALSLLRGLHTDPLRRYDRIVVVGHSLGSVIAYDAITYLWQEMHSKHSNPAVVSQEAFESVEQISKASKSNRVSPDAFREAQRALWSEQRGNGNDWRITDLVTLGSPLTYASYLLSDGIEDFQDRLMQRVLPTCPPQLEDGRDIGFTSKEYCVGAEKRTLRLLHHAAAFACTRWTNIYFPGDIIGGRVAPSLGWGVCDQPISSRQWWGFGGYLPTSHTRYWNISESHALEALRRALDLADECSLGRLKRTEPVR